MRVASTRVPVALAAVGCTLAGMVSSQNGWRANDPSVVSKRQVEGSNVKLVLRNGAPGDLILVFACGWDRRVADIDRVADDWGYAERLIRGSSTQTSNHASGTAGDLDATEHPLGTAPTANFTDAQIREIRGMIRATGNVLRWGGDYSGRKDGMHVEVNDGQTEDTCSRALRDLRDYLGSAGTPAGSILPVGPTSTEVLELGSHGPAVEALQERLRTVYRLYAGGLVVDGQYGPATAAAVAEFQRRKGGLTVDGKFGPMTRAAIGL